MALPTGFGALGQRDYRVYYAGNLVSQVGSWMLLALFLPRPWEVRGRATP